MHLNTKLLVNKCVFYIAFVLIFSPFKSLSQDWLGINTSNYAGISNVFSQPASIADNRLKFDMNLASINFSLGNNFFAFNPALLRPTSINTYLQNADIQKKAYNGKSKYFFINLDAIGPSALISLSSKHAIGLFSRARFMLNFDDLDESLAQNIYKDFSDPNFYLRRHNDDNISMQVHAWSEYGLSYARTIYDRKMHFVKVGMNAKVLKGLGSSYLFIKNFDFSLKNKDFIDVFSTKINYGHSSNINIGLKDNFAVDYSLAPGYSMGFDFGLVYEFRPKYKEYHQDLDGKPNVPFTELNKYLFRVGVSLTDVGSIKYTKSPLSTDFTANITNMALDTFSNIASLQHLDTLIHTIFNIVSADSNASYKMGLPTLLSIQIDYHILRGFYVNFTPTFSLKSNPKDVNKTHYFSSLILTPRWESKWLGVYSPISFNKELGVTLGLGLRLGPVILGTTNLLLPFIANKDFSGTNVYFMLKLPIPYSKRKDIDKDGVSDKMDECKNLPGTWASKGCPDMDSDAVADIYDDCPKTKGLVEYHGCPDTDKDGLPDNRDQCPFDSGSVADFGCPDRDGDGVIDISDSCPDIKGLAKFFGCPDNDNDGIIDIKDSCPDLFGLFMNNGCPDTDGDGVIDKLDECPNEFGLKTTHGCPDKDNDSVIDKFDNCPNVPGPVKFHGCPDTDGDGVVDSADECMYQSGLLVFKGCPDRDNDSVPDKIDKCPDTYGLITNNGCPLEKVVIKEELAKLTKEEQEIVKTAFQNLEFETDSSIILSKSFPSLDSLSKVLLKKTEYRLSIAGHTDNVGKSEANVKLSENRANAVKDYLVQKTIDPKRIFTAGYGSQKPIAPNTTAEGRQKNRRVELKIIK